MNSKQRRERLRAIHEREREVKDEAPRRIRIEQEERRKPRWLVAKAAAKWWADQLRGSASFDNGDNPYSDEGAKVELLAKMAREKASRVNTPEKIDQFEEVLANYLYWLITIFGRIGVFVDYDPCIVITDAAEKAGVKADMTSLPCFTQVWVKPGEVQVKPGYGAQFEVLPLPDVA